MFFSKHFTALSHFCFEKNFGHRLKLATGKFFRLRRRCFKSCSLLLSSNQKNLPPFWMVDFFGAGGRTCLSRASRKTVHWTVFLPKGKHAHFCSLAPNSSPAVLFVSSSQNSCHLVEWFDPIDSQYFPKINLLYPITISRHCS